MADSNILNELEDFHFSEFEKEASIMSSEITKKNSCSDKINQSPHQKQKENHQKTMNQIIQIDQSFQTDIIQNKNGRNDSVSNEFNSITNQIDSILSFLTNYIEEKKNYLKNSENTNEAGNSNSKASDESNLNSECYIDKNYLNQIIENKINHKIEHIIEEKLLKDQTKINLVLKEEKQKISDKQNLKEKDFQNEKPAKPKLPNINKEDVKLVNNVELKRIKKLQEKRRKLNSKIIIKFL